MLAERPMWAMIVVVPDVLVEHQVQVPLAHDQHPVGALSADAPDETFGIAVRPRCSGWRVGCNVIAWAVTRGDGELAGSVPVVVRTLGFLVLRRLLGVVGCGRTTDAKEVEIGVPRARLEDAM